MPKAILTDLSNLQNPTTAVATINANNDTIERAFDNTLSRDGSAPNAMNANLDMNSNRILNLPVAAAPTEPIRKSEFDAVALNGGSVVNVGTTTTLPAGSNATVTNTGTPYNLTLNFGIPAGATGPSGAGTGDMLKANNLSDLTNAATARTNLGLGNVTNTSDASKPVSTAQQAALDLKADASALALKSNLASPTFTGIPAAPTAANGTNTTQIATTAFVLANSSTGGVTSLNGQTGSLLLSLPPQGRLTLTSGVAVMVAPSMAANTLYYTPSVGNQIPLYDGTRMVPTTFTELSMLTTDTTKSPAAVTANSNYDVFVWNDSGTIRLSRGPVWTNDTTRSAGTTLSMVNGIYTNSAAITNGPAINRGTYVGTIRSDGSNLLGMQFGGSGSGGVAGYILIWNAYNRTQCVANVVDTQAGYAYSSSTWRPAGNSNLNTVRYIVGLVEDNYTVTYSVRHDSAAASGAFSQISFGLDTLSTQSTQRAFAKGGAGLSAVNSPVVTYSAFPTLGYHYIAAVEAGDGSSSTTMNNGSDGRLSFTGWW